MMLAREDRSTRRKASPSAARYTTNPTSKPTINVPRLCMAGRRLISQCTFVSTNEYRPKQKASLNTVWLSRRLHSRLLYYHCVIHW